MASQQPMSAQDALSHLVNDLYRREATGRGVFALELAQELVSAALESGSKQQDEAEVTDVRMQFFEDAAMFECRLKIRAKAFPPRPPIDTRVTFGIRDVTHSEAGNSGSVMFRVEQPLTLSSRFADILMAALGKVARKLPISIDALRHKDSLVTVDFAKMVGAVRPDLAPTANQVRLYGLKVKQGSAWLQIGFIKT
jgi:hypothetical protein